MSSDDRPVSGGHSSDHATAAPGPGRIQLVEAPQGADEQGMNVGRITDWRNDQAFGFLETLLASRLFLHRSALHDVGLYGSHLVGRAVRFQLAQGENGRLHAVNAHLLPEGTNLKPLFFAELARPTVESQPVLGKRRRFRFIEPNSFDCTNEKRPTITVAALRDIAEDRDLLFVHTRWPSTAPLSQTQWLKLTEEVAATHFIFGPPPLVYLSTQEGLYRLNALQVDPDVTLVPDAALKSQLEDAAPHIDD